MSGCGLGCKGKDENSDNCTSACIVMCCISIMLCVYHLKTKLVSMVCLL